ncbi:peptidase C14 [Ilyonectria robusta]
MAETPRYTLDVVYPPPGETGSKPRIDIIFVHGLGGDNLKTWSDKESGKQWISDPEFLQTWESDVRVLTLGYNTTNVMLNVNPGRPIIFVTHSLGGLVVKKAVLLCQDSTRFQDIKNSITGIVFLGTPHNGSDHAAVLSTVHNVVGFFTREGPNVITEEMRTYSTTVLEINESFMGAPPNKLSLVSFFETKPMMIPSLRKGVKRELIVIEGSAKLFGDKALNLAMSCNHVELSKFASPSDSRFQDLWDQINVLVMKGLKETVMVPGMDNVQFEDRADLLSSPKQDPTPQGQ